MTSEWKDVVNKRLLKSKNFWLANGKQRWSKNFDKIKSLNTIPLQNTWFSSMFLKSANTVENIDIKQFEFPHVILPKTIVRANKYKISIKPGQDKILKKWQQHYRFTYNRTVDYINESNNVRVINDNYPSLFGEEKREEYFRSDESYRKQLLRNWIIPKKENQHRKWISETPKFIRENAVFEAYKNYKAAMTNKKNGNIQHFKLGHMLRKKKSFTLGGINCVKLIRENEENKADKKTNFFKFFSTFFEKEDTIFYSAEYLPNKITNENSRSDYPDTSIHYDGSHYYLVVPIKKEPKPMNQKCNLVSIDPGVRTMLTCYFPEISLGMKIGDECSKRLMDLYKKVDFLKSIEAKLPTKKQKNIIQHKIKRILLKIKNLQTELHCKVAKFLCSNVKNVVIPKFGSKDMTKKDGRNIRTGTVRSMLSIGHGYFFKRLITKAEETGTHVCEVAEDYTTRTCGKCGYIKSDIGSKSKWICNVCQHSHDRDLNAARNICFKPFEKRI